MNKYGIIRVDSIPDKASIFINEQFLGITSLDINEVNPGTYSYKLILEGFDEYNGNLKVYENKIIYIIVDFENNKRSIDYIDLPSEQELIDTSSISEDSSMSHTNESPVNVPQIKPQLTIEESTLNTLNDIKEILQLLTDNSTKQIERTSFSKFDTGIQTLVTAVITVPTEDDVSITGYTRVAIWDVLGRLSQTLFIINQGPGTIYVRKSNDGKTFSAIEIPIFAGEKGTFNDLYEMRIRTEIAGTQYRVTEYESSLIINNFDDRAATPVHIHFAITAVAIGPHAITTRAIYTVPTGFKAKVNGVYVYIEIATAAGVPQRRSSIVSLTNPTLGNFSVLTRSFSGDNTVGMVKEGELGFAYTLLTGESLLLQTLDISTGGTVFYGGSAEITQYFSYPT